MRVKRGDTVVIPLTGSVTDADMDRLKASLVDRMPGVVWSLIDTTSMNHALVYEGNDEYVVNLTAENARLASKLETALDLLTEIIGRFSEKGSIGGIDNSRRSGWVDVGQVSRWQQWLADTRKFMREGPSA